MITAKSLNLIAEEVNAPYQAEKLGYLLDSLKAEARQGKFEKVLDKPLSLEASDVLENIHGFQVSGDLLTISWGNEVFETVK